MDGDGAPQQPPQCLWVQELVDGRETQGQGADPVHVLQSGGEDPTTSGPGLVTIARIWPLHVCASTLTSEITS